jgi:hypothetical protein
LRKNTQEQKKKILREFFKSEKLRYGDVPSNSLYDEEEDQVLEAIASNPSGTEEDWARDGRLINRLAEIDKEEAK